MQPMSLKEMLVLLRLEARISSNPAHGSHLEESHTALLRRTQEDLYNAWDWPMLNIVQTKDVCVATRYLAWPDKIAPEGLRKVWAHAPDGRWRELTFGIGAEHHNIHDSDTGQTCDTVLRWQHYLSLEAEQVHRNMLEIWPVPDRDIRLRFEGKRALFAFANPERDHSTLDGPLIVLHAAVEILTANKAEDAPLKLQKAQTRMDLLKRRESGPDNRRLNMAGGGGYRRLRPGIDYIPSGA